MLQTVSTSRLLLAVGVLALTGVIQFLRRLHFHRSLYKNLPGPPRNYFLGSLISMGKVLAKQPRKAAPQTFATCLQREYNLPDCFYLDSWPFGPDVLIVLNADLMHEFTVKHSLLKHPTVDNFMKNFGGPGNLVSSEGGEWKKWRSAFNPGFSTKHLMTQVPIIIDQVQIFLDQMSAHAAKGDLFRLEPLATRLTVDIIGKIVLDLNLKSQTGPNTLVDAFVSQTRWQSMGAQFDLTELIDFRRPIIQTWNNWTMDRYVNQALEARFASRGSREKSKHVVDLALETYLKEAGDGSDDVADLRRLPAEFKRVCISNLKTFIFAGHDTTSATICYAYYYLSKHPDYLEKIRKEHDDIFGPNPKDVAKMIIEDPPLLNQLEYTLAVIKEVLRIQPPASTVRLGQKDYFLHDPSTGEQLPTEHFLIWPVDVGLHRNPKYWSDPDVFRPSRFLPGSTDDLSAWIPFSKGPRNCIGQELAIIESKVILAMTLRMFDFHAAYDELEKLKGDGTGYSSDTSGVQEQFGEVAYQIQLGTAKPREGMPCRLSLRK